MKCTKPLFVTTLLCVLFTLPGMAQPEVMGTSGGAKSESAAVSQALINTVMPVGVGYGMVKLFNNNTVQSVGAILAVYGMVVGPSTGNFYANDHLHGGIGALTRLGAVFLLEDGTREVFGDEFADALNADNESISFKDTDIIVGSALMLGTMIYNIVSAPASVREYNRSMGYSMNIKSLPGTGRSFPMLTARFRF